MSVLIVESVPGVRRGLRGFLRPFMVVIVDLVLPDRSGLDVVDTLRGSGSAAHVIVMSDSPADADRIRALEHGAEFPAGDGG